jgi:diguanylate cyclase (GGDEF)-like protein
MLAMGFLAMAWMLRKARMALRSAQASAATQQHVADTMQQLARTDAVTGLLNRAGLNYHLAAYVKNSPTPTALLWLDLDRFKEVNDSLGHHMGDQVLAVVAARLREASPQDACVARFGGDEFILACACPDSTQAQSLAADVLDRIVMPMMIEDMRLEVGCSIGVALLIDHGADIATALQSADMALHQAKMDGRKRVVFYDPAMARRLLRRKEIEADLRLAMARDELSVFFQPLVDLTTGRIRAFEALVRWFHPEKGEIRPDEFIPVAEETGAIITLGNWVTARAARVAATWPDTITLAVNLSPMQIRAPGAALGIEAALREAGLAPHRLELEITETVLLEHGPTTDSFIRQLSQLGVRFALDDFGTGYSSLGYLAKYPFSKIKIDRSFVGDMAQGTASEAIVRAVSGMGRGLGMEIVAEGLERLDQVLAVREAGCTLGQGWYFSRAVPDYIAAVLVTQEEDRWGLESDDSLAVPNAPDTEQRIGHG